MHTRISLAIGLALSAIAIAVALSRAPAVVARSNKVGVEAQLLGVSQAAQACQANEVIPAGTTAIRLSLEALFGPRVSIRVMHDGEVITKGDRSAGWTSKSVTVPVHRVRRVTRGAEVCFALASTGELVYLNGGRSPRAPISLPGATSPTPVGVRIEYLRPGDRSWWSMASSVAWRVGLGRSVSGSWIVFALLLSMAALTVVVVRLLAREPQ